MGSNQMIDLISHGLDLRKNLTVSSQSCPQVIRNVSARPIRYLLTDSAISADSAAMSKNNSGNMFVVKAVADYADIAERHSRQTPTIADELRKNCGLNTAKVSATINEPPSDSLKTVTCNDCEHFSPDRIGDGVGIGICAIGIISTKIAGYSIMPLYRYSDRYCDQFSKLMQ